MTTTNLTIIGLSLKNYDKIKLYDIFKGAAKARNRQGINTTRKNLKNTTEMQKNTTIIKKSLADF